MFKVTVGDYSIFLRHQGLPNIYRDYRRNAALVDEFNLDFRDGDACFVGVSRGEVWPFLVVAQRFFPGSDEGFDPAVLLIPEARTVFIGAGERILGYKLERPERLWEDEAAGGFWNWARHGDHVFMSAELELAAWDTAGNKIWTVPVEPPWSYRVEGERVELTSGGRESVFRLSDGPPVVNGR